MDVQALFDQGDYAAVIKKLKKGEPRPILAFAYQKSKLWEEAMNVWTTLIVKYPDAAEYFVERGVCKFNLRFKHAILDFNEAIEMDPTNPYFYSCRAYIRDKTGDTEGSVEDYTKALDLDPEDAITLNNLGLAEQKLGFTARARERFKYSDDLMGVKTIDSRDPGDYQKLTSTPPAKSSMWQEFKKMLSLQGFKDFWRDLRG
jgi:tetratricopeptide (TPR) repeat protein